MPMEKLDADTIKKINSYSEDKSNAEIWKELWLHRSTVWKYRKDIADTLKDKLSKWDRKKLQLLEHYSDKDIQEMLNYIAQNTKKKIETVLWEPWHLRFAMIGDSHIWAKECDIDALNRFYEDAKAEWVECVVHAGDLVDGCGVYPWQQFEQTEIWYEDQVNKVVKDYPNIWVPTYYIGGNHDQSYLKSMWADICRTISWLRDDLVNLGYYDAVLDINWIKIQLQHWAWWSSYSPDYKLLRYIDTIQAWKEPDVFVLWHYHRAIHSLHRWIHGFMPGAFLWPNMLAKRYKFPNIIWWWIIDITKDEEWKKKLTATFMDK